MNVCKWLSSGFCYCALRVALFFENCKSGGGGEGGGGGGGRAISESL